MPDIGSNPPAPPGADTPGSRTTGDAAAPPPPTVEYRPPPLPPLRGAGLAHIVIPATATWLLLFVVLLFFVPTLRANDQMIWLWTALAGWVLGLIGLSIYGWQRSAARRGTKGSSRGALEETFGSSGEFVADGADGESGADGASGADRGSTP